MDLEKKLMNGSNHSIFNNNLRFKTILGIGFIVVICLIFSIFVWLQNTQTKRINQKIQTQNYPILVLGNQLYGEVTTSAVYLRAHLMTQTANSKQLILDTWDKSIYSTLDSLQQVIDKLNNPQYTAKIKQLDVLARQLFSNHIQIINYFEQKENILNLKLTATDSANAQVLLQKITRSTQIRDSLGQKVMKMGREARLQIKKIIEDLNQIQTQEIKENLTVINRGLDLINTGAWVMALSLFLGAVIVSFILLDGIQRAIYRITRLLNQLAKGEIPRRLTITTDEFGVMYQAINQLADNLAKAGDFAVQIGEGNFEQSYTAQSEKDVLGNSLLQMRDKLLKVGVEEDKRNWIAQGLAKFSDIIRTHNSSFSELGEAILPALIEYVGGNQGGLFVAYPQTNQLVHLDLITAYAYQRKKYLEKRIKINPDYAETLLGQVYLEREKVYLTDVPQDYLRVTSGLGDASPNYLLILPIQTNSQVEGILEIASFKPLEVYEVEFIERVCESLAITIVSVKNNENTQALLKELKVQTDALRTQEEEMRQNMEELTSTQELMRSKQNELELLKANLEQEVENQTAELRATLERADLITRSASDGMWDMVVPEDGIITAETPFIWSPQLLKSLGYSPAEFPNVLASWLKIIHADDALLLQKEFVAQLKDVSNQTVFDHEHRLCIKSGEYRWFRAVATVLRDNQGKAVRIAGFINDIQTQKDLDRVLAELKANEEMMRQKQDELATSNAKLQSNQAVLRKAIEKNRQTEDDLKHKNQELEANTLIFQEIYRYTPGMIYQFKFDVTTKLGYFSFVSDYVSKILGYSKEEFVGMDNDAFWQIIHPNDLETFKTAQYQTLKHQAEFDWEGRMCAKNGNWRWIRGTSGAGTQQGNFILFVGIFMDISDFKQQTQAINEMNSQLKNREVELQNKLIELNTKQYELELANQKMQSNEKMLKKTFEKNREFEKEILAKNQQLLAGEELLQDISQNTPGVLYQFTLELDNQQVGFRFVSDYIQNLLGYTPQEFKNLDSRQLTQIIHPAHRQAYYQAQNHSLQTLSTFNWEGQMQHQTGKWVWVKAISSPRQTAKQIVSTGIFINLDEIKQKELEIQAINDRLQTNERELKQNMLELMESQENLKRQAQELDELRQKILK
ncbi:MAG: PAS domain-containing protein [Microscillaceae bacterium]|jgi:PAS domain S-box-containing protein|nr:PAS domain-containing protein [Microscillaceae bacterium]